MPNFAKINLLVLIVSLPLISAAQITSGLWSTGCQNGLKKEQIYGRNNRVITTESFFQDKNCTDESFRFQTIGFVSYYTTPENSSAPESFIDFLYEEIYLTVFKQNVISDFNSRKVCGYSDWATTQAQNITGLKCAIFNLNRPTKIPSAGETKYGIYLSNGGKLYYGQLSQELNATSPEKRPNQINFGTEYSFQP